MRDDARCLENFAPILLLIWSVGILQNQTNFEWIRMTKTATEPTKLLFDMFYSSDDDAA